MINGIEIHEKNLMSWIMLIKNIIAQIIMLVSINMMSSVEHGKIKDGLILLILMVGFSGILDIG